MLNDEIEGEVPEGYAGHHLIGIAEAKGSVAMQEAAECGYNINNGHNGIALPTDETEAMSTGLPLHTGRHLGEYADMVAGRLEVLDDQYVESIQEGEPWSSEHLLSQVQEVENSIREDLLAHNVSLQNTDPNKISVNWRIAVYTVWKNVGRDPAPEITRYTQLDVQEVAQRYYTKGGTALKEPLPHITFEVESLEGLRERDSLWAGLPYLVFSSPRLREALSSLRVDNIEYYPATITHSQSGETITDYKIANIVGLVACFDWEQSRYELNPSGPTVKRIDRLVIDEARIPTGLLLFRLQEMRTVTLCDEGLAQGLIKLEITGVDFVSTSAFSTG